MAVFNSFPRLYEQSNQNATQGYYGGLAKPTPTSTFTANQGLAKTGTATSPSLNTTPTPAPVTAGPSYGTRGQLGDGSMGSEWSTLTPEQIARLNGRYLAGNAYDNGLIIDQSQAEYDPELGWITGKDNIREDNSGLFRYGPLGNILLGSAAVLGGAGLAGAFGGGAAGVSAADMAMPTLTGAADTTLAAAPGLAAGAGGAASVAAPAMAVPELVGAASPAMSAAPSLAGGSAMPSLGTMRGIAGFGLPLYNALQGRGNEGQYRDDIAGAANRGDPWGSGTDPNGTPNRTASQARLWELFNDPSSIVNTPGYRFQQEQGEQGIERQAAQRGYFRSPNMLYDLSKFNQGLASTVYDKEMQRLFAMSGVQFDPGTGAQIAATGANNASSMNRANTTAWMDFGRTFIDWLGGVG